MLFVVYSPRVESHNSYPAKRKKPSPHYQVPYRLQQRQDWDKCFISRAVVVDPTNQFAALTSKRLVDGLNVSLLGVVFS